MYLKVRFERQVGDSILPLFLMNYCRFKISYMQSKNVHNFTTQVNFVNPVNW